MRLRDEFYYRPTERPIHLQTSSAKGGTSPPRRVAKKLTPLRDDFYHRPTERPIHVQTSSARGGRRPPRRVAKNKCACATNSIIVLRRGRSTCRPRAQKVERVLRGALLKQMRLRDEFYHRPTERPIHLAMLPSNFVNFRMDHANRFRIELGSD